MCRNLFCVEDEICFRKKMNLETIFSSSRGKYLELKKILSSQGFNVPNHSNEESLTESTPSKLSSTSNAKNCLYDLSPRHDPPHSKDYYSSSDVIKEILGPPKTLDLPSCKSILEMTLGT